MYKPLMVCLSTMLICWAVAGCGNKGELYLPPDVQLAQELDVVNERIGDVTPATDSPELTLPENDEVTIEETSTGQPTADELEEAKPAKKRQP